MVPTPTSPESTGQGTTRTGQKSASTSLNITIQYLDFGMLEALEVENK